MKKILFILAFLPFFSFGDLVPDDMLFYYWPYVYVRGGTSPAVSTPSSYAIDFAPIPASSLDSYLFSHSFSVLVKPDGSLIRPTANGTSLTNSSMALLYPLQAVDGSGWFNLVRVCPSVQVYATIAARLFFYGYTGTTTNINIGPIVKEHVVRD